MTYTLPGIARLRADMAQSRPCRLEGFTYGHLEGYARPDSHANGRWRVASMCGTVVIHVSAATAAGKYKSDSCPTFYYE